MIDYNKRLVEVDEILNYLSEEDLLKIPEDIRVFIKSNKATNYIWNYDESKKLKDQNVSRDTIVFLSYLNMKYLLNEEQKKLMERIHVENEKKAEEKKREKYNSNDIFKKYNYIQEETKVIDNSETLEMINIQEGFFTKIINKIKEFYKKIRIWRP